jgi:hypothetical protein
MRFRGDGSQRYRQRGAAAVAGVVTSLGLVALALWFASHDGPAVDREGHLGVGDRGPSSSSAIPQFASDEDALNAATAAYARYQAEIDRSLSVMDDSALSTVAEGAALTAARGYVVDFRERGVRQTGETSIDTTSLVSGAQGLLGGEDAVQIYVCVDVTEVGIVDASGQSQLGPSMESRGPFIATLVWDSDLSDFLVSTDSFWEGKNFCG